jgi:hypothetical protein
MRILSFPTMFLLFRLPAHREKRTGGMLRAAETQLLAISF